MDNFYRAALIIFGVTVIVSTIAAIKRGKLPLGLMGMQTPQNSYRYIFAAALCFGLGLIAIVIGVGSFLAARS